MRNLPNLLSHLDARPGCPYYGVDIDKCVCKAHSYVSELNEHYFRVERGNRFYMKLELYDLPGPLSPDDKATLTRKRSEDLQGVAGTALIYNIDSVDIQIATQQHQDSYRLTASTSAGEATLRFTLYIERTFMQLYTM